MADLGVDTARTNRAKIQHGISCRGLAKRFPCLPVSWPRASPNTIKQKTGRLLMSARAGGASYGFHPIAWGGASVFWLDRGSFAAPLKTVRKSPAQPKTE